MSHPQTLTAENRHRPATKDRQDTPSFAQSEQKDSLAMSAWPMIHHSPDGTKNSPLLGPTNGDVDVQRFRGDSPAIVLTIDDDLLYYQAGQSFIYCFSIDDFEKPLRQVDLNAGFPAVGGNIVDDEGHVYFTRFGQLIRFDRGLKNPVVSEDLEPVDALYNGVAFMADGNLLVTSATFAHVVSPREKNGKLEVLSTTDLRQSAYNGVPTFAPRFFGPRPVYDSQGGVYINGQHFIAKLTYFPQIAKLETNPLWAVRDPQPGGTFALSNPILVDDQVWAVSKPPAEQPMQLLCLDQSSGELLGQCTPFPMALGQSAGHTLGAVPDNKLVIVICNTEDTTGGVVAIDSETLDTCWHFPLAQIGEAFAISATSGAVYISAFDEDSSRIKIWSIALKSGEGTVLTEQPSTEAPASSLPSVGPDGNLFYPVLDGCLKIRQR